MALPVMARGEPGKIIIEDEREDGTIVVLVCEEQDPSETTGVPVAPEPSAGNGDDDNGNGWVTFRMRLRKYLGMGYEPALKEGWSLRVDTNALPGEPLRFRSTRFIERARLEAERQSGNEKPYVKLTLDDAADWGWIT